MAFVDHLQRHLQTAGKVVAVAHTAYNVGKGIYQFAQAAAPFVVGAAALTGSGDTVPPLPVHPKLACAGLRAGAPSWRRGTLGGL